MPGAAISLRIFLRLFQPPLGAPRQFLIIIRGPQHRLLGFFVAYLLGEGADRFGALAPMLRIVDRDFCHAVRLTTTPLFFVILSFRQAQPRLRHLVQRGPRLLMGDHARDLHAPLRQIPIVVFRSRRAGNWHRTGPKSSLAQAVRRPEQVCLPSAFTAPSPPGSRSPCLASWMTSLATALVMGSSHVANETRQS